MNSIAITVFLVIAVPLVAFLVWAALQDAVVKIKPGEMGLVIARGKPADKGLPPGNHLSLRLGRIIEIYPAVEVAYITASDDQIVRLEALELTYADPPLSTSLGDGANAMVQYTIRFTVMQDRMARIHKRLGAGGIRAFVRDESRRVIIETLSDSSVTVADTWGPARTALEARVGAAVRSAFEEAGLAVATFNLRDAGLGATGDVLQATVRAREELVLEQAAAGVRLARAKHEAEVNALLAGSLSDGALRYLQIEVWRDMVSRWDGSHLVLSHGGLLDLHGTVPTTGESDQAMTAS